MDAIPTLSERVQAGAAVLDEYWQTHDNGFTAIHWTERIIPEELEIKDIYYCVLGQSFGSFRNGLIELGFVDEDYNDHAPMPEHIANRNFDLGFAPVGTKYHTTTLPYAEANDAITEAWIEYLANREVMGKDAIQTSQPA